MSPRGDRDRTAELRDELEADILPRQLRALERVAGRLRDERPTPAPAFRARLDNRIRGTAPGTDAPAPAPWRLWAALTLTSGLVLLVAVALLVAAGEPGGH
jgi:hypothetical protein